MEKLSLTNNLEKIRLFKYSIIYIKKRFNDFDINKFKFIIDKNIDFEIKISYSLDFINWSNPVLINEWGFDFSNINQLNNLYISLVCNKINFDGNFNKQNLDSIYINNNVENINTHELLINSITYDNINIEFNENEISINTIDSIVSKIPKWNFNDSQFVNIRRWLDTCFSLVQTYGHQSIYFKTEITDVNNTLVTNRLRDVVSVKKIPIISPDNELPQDRIVYTEWDMPNEGEFIIHIVDEIFKLAFGNDKVPLSKDYLFLPILNKLFRVSSVQPVNGFMGKIGWWEVYLTKYEDDESIDDTNINTNLKNMYSDMYGDINGFTDTINIFEEVSEILNNNLLDTEKIDIKTTDEKKSVTNNFNNKLIDSTHYIDLKDTEIQREFYSKRLEIISVNPDMNTFPITMYNCAAIEKRVVALSYNIKDLISNSKNNIYVDEFKFSTNFVLLNKFSGELFDFNTNQLSNITLEINRKKLSIISHNNQKSFIVDYEFIENEFYQILLTYNNNLNQIGINIFMLKNNIKNLVFNDLYIINNHTKFNLTDLIMYGGKYLSSEIVLQINDKNILTDNVTPILVMNKFGLT